MKNLKNEILKELIRLTERDYQAPPEILDVLKEKKVLMVQGSGFNWDDNNHIRMVFLPNMDELKIAIDRFSEYLTDYRK